MNDSHDSVRPLGFVGLGNMGQPMAQRLLAAGHRLRVWNRSIGRTDPLVALGAERAESPGAACEPDGIAFTMVADDRALESVALEPGGLLDRLGPGGVHVSLSTISPATSRRLAALHAERGAAYVTAPVFGRPDAAEAGKLWVVTSGPETAKARFRPLIPAIGQGVYDFGEEPGAANVVKLAGNFLIASAIEALGEATALVSKNGVNPAAVMKMFGETLFACRVYQGYGAQIAERRFSPAGFRLALGLKDVNLALSTGEASDVPLPLGSLLHDRFLSMRAQGDGDLDWSAIALGAARAAGLS